MKTPSPLLAAALLPIVLAASPARADEGQPAPSSSSHLVPAPIASPRAEPPPSARPASQDPYALQGSMMLGLAQWMLWGGGNVAAELKVGRLAFELSHGQSLHFDNLSIALTSAERDAGVKVGMPWTTGGGVGFRITPNLHVLVEVKAHRYEVEGPRGDAIRYTSFTVGPGIFYNVRLYKGLFVQPNLRWWPTVASTYDDKGVLARADGTMYRHERHDLVPFVNINLGWTFDGQ